MRDNKSNPPFVLLEGMSLAGKSTAVHGLKKAFPNWKSFHIGLSDNKSMYSVAHYINRRGNWDKEAVSILYAGALLVEVENFVWPEQPTFQDSCALLRSFGHYTAHGKGDVLKLLEQIAELHPKFTKAFVFTTGIKERRRRLKQRMEEEPSKVNASDLLVLTNPEVFTKMNEAIIKYSRRYFNAEVINSEDFTIEQTLEYLSKKILDYSLIDPVEPPVGKVSYNC